LLGAAGLARADAVTDWDAIAATTITPPPGTTFLNVTSSEQRPIYQVDLSTLHLAIYDAVNSIDRRHEPYAAMPTTPTRGASQEAAAVGAAYGVLKGLFPNRSSLYQPQYDAYLAASAGNPARQRGLAIGAEVAAEWLSIRANDGRLTPTSYTSTGVPGDFEPGPTPLVNPFLPFVKPFAIPSADRFRAPGPPSLASEDYADGLNEVQAYGSTASTLRSADDSDLARFHTEAPPIFWPRNLRRFASDRQSIADNARLLALLWVTHADALLGCFESKYHYRFWRPRTAIPRAAEDGNAETTADAGWTPFMPTPNHPEYPAAHSCGHGAMAEALREFYGTKKLHFTEDSAVAGLLTPVRSFDSTDEAVREVADARVFGGMHYRFSTEDGAELGRRTTKWIGKRFFRAIDDRDHEDDRDDDRDHDRDHDRH